jgi:co-chaperonin GroES (HSP10)
MAQSIATVSGSEGTRLIPCGDNVVVRPQETAEFKGRIIIPNSCKEVFPTTGKIIEIGGELCDENGTPTTDFQIGDTVIYSKYSGIECKFEDGARVLILKGADIIAIMGNDLKLVEK